MYVQIDIQVAEAIIHEIGRIQAEEEAMIHAGGRKQADEEGWQEAQPMRQPSLLARLIRRLTARPAYDPEVSRMQESDPSLACE